MALFDKGLISAAAVLGGLMGTTAMAAESTVNDGICSVSVSGGNYVGVEDGSTNPDRPGWYKYSFSWAVDCSESFHVQILCGVDPGHLYLAPGAYSGTSICWYAPNWSTWSYSATRVGSGVVAAISGPLP